MLDRMSLLLRFSAICDAGSLRQAAQVLNITQPALSRSLSTLEAIYGKPLLERHARGVSPTAFGERLLSSVSRLARDWALAEERLVEDGRMLEGKFRISGGPLWDSLVLPDVIGELQRRFPRLTVELQYQTGDALHAALLEGRIDIAFGGLHRLDRGHDLLVARELTRVHDRLVARRGHPIHACAPGDYTALIGMPWVIYSADPIYEQQIVHTLVERTGVMPNIMLRCSSLMATLRSLQNGDYLTMLPTSDAGNVFGPDILAAPIDIGRRIGPSGARYRRVIADYPPLTALLDLCERFIARQAKTHGATAAGVATARDADPGRIQINADAPEAGTCPGTDSPASSRDKGA
ncbi:LysR family transcriptional regulator [Rhizobium halophytocola]|uniref:DNA-binding transcriptional LysR family regulator n=1 Tax=Rhizobium halophytocola TaxID=735519 RepID=A0ABS4E0X3_9HYPH|nr:LysR family transcriptional regulator [Rhizobium halophytocola]MBP1851554.1 DNA-binding transcriptional LysR family regulator [Rhizobium halophytocola]